MNPQPNKVVRWPGKEGGEKTIQKLAAAFSSNAGSLRLVLPPDDFKDERDWFKAQNKDLADENSAIRLAQEFVAGLQPLKLRSAAPDVTDEEIEEAAQSAAKHARPCRPEERCMSLRHKLMKNKKDGHYEDWTLRCGCSSCDGCFARKKRLRLDELLYFAGTAIMFGHKLYAISGHPDDWEAIHKEIRRSGKEVFGAGSFARIFLSPEHHFEALTTAPVKGARELTWDEAQGFLKENIARAVTTGRGTSFCSSSRDWRIIKEKKPSEFADIGYVKRTSYELDLGARKFGTRRRTVLPIDKNKVEVGVYDPISDPEKAAAFEKWVQGIDLGSIEEEMAHYPTPSSIRRDSDKDVSSPGSNGLEWLDSAWEDFIRKVHLSG